jgi:hypothetical protein
MTTLTESDLKDLKDLINSRFDELKTGQTRLEIGQAKIEARLDEWRTSVQKIPDLSEKVGELKNWKQIGLIIITGAISAVLSGTIGGVIGWLIRGGRS